MPVPTYDQLMLPLLEFASDGNEHHVKEASEAIGNYLKLSGDELNELLPSGKKTKFYDRVHWAKTYLTKAELLHKTGRGYFQITSRGIDVLNSKPPFIDRHFLMKFAEFADFQTRSNDKKGSTETPTQETQQTPKELIHSTHQELRKELTEELLDYVLTASPIFFEQLVVDLLLSMGYGGSIEGSGQTTRATSDGGIDGFIQEDKLGLDTIYIQAKRWGTGNGVGRPSVQGFVGSLMGNGGTKGVFITTSHFSKEAIEYASNLQNIRLILIDGTQLAQLMIEHDIGVSVEATYVVKKVDRDYFDID